MFKRGSLLGLLLLVGCNHAHAEAVPLLPLIQLCDTVNGTCSISQPLVLYNASAPCIHEWEDECTPRYKFQTSVPVIVSSVLTCSPLWAGSYCEIYISTSSTITITATGFVNATSVSLEAEGAVTVAGTVTASGLGNMGTPNYSPGSSDSDDPAMDTPGLRAELGRSEGGSTLAGSGGRLLCGDGVKQPCCQPSIGPGVFTSNAGDVPNLLKPTSAFRAALFSQGTRVFLNQGVGARAGGRVWLAGSLVSVAGQVTADGSTPDAQGNCASPVPHGGAGGGSVVLVAPIVQGTGIVSARGGGGAAQVGTGSSSEQCASYAAGGGGAVLLLFEQLSLTLTNVAATGGSVALPPSSTLSVPCLFGSPGLVAMGHVPTQPLHWAGTTLEWMLSGQARTSFALRVFNVPGSGPVGPATRMDIPNGLNITSLQIGGSAVVVSSRLYVLGGGFLRRPGTGVGGDESSGSQGLQVSQGRLLPLVYSMPWPNLPFTPNPALDLRTTDLNVGPGGQLSSLLFNASVRATSVTVASGSGSTGGNLDTAGVLTIRAGREVSIGGTATGQGTLLVVGAVSIDILATASLMVSQLGIWSSTSVNVGGTVQATDSNAGCNFPAVRSTCNDLRWEPSMPIPPVSNYSMVIAGRSSVSIAGTASAGAALICGSSVIVGGSLTSDGLGCSAGVGAGAGHSGQGSVGGGGGGHGGPGGRGSNGAIGGVVYGNATVPIQPGSGGGAVTLSGTSGGGFLRVEAPSSLTVLAGAVVSASAAQPQAQQGGGGAAGGGLALITSKLSGGGLVLALGGSGSSGGGGGGGGRVGFSIPVLNASQWLNGRGIVLFEGRRFETPPDRVRAGDLLLPSGTLARGFTRIPNLALGALCVASAADEDLPLPLPLPRLLGDVQYTSIAANFSGIVNVTGGWGAGGGLRGGNGTLTAPPCGPGFATLRCVACPVGTYKSDPGVGQCQPCKNKPDHSTYSGVATTTDKCPYTCYPGTHPPDCLSPFDALVEDIGFPRLIAISVALLVLVATLAVCGAQYRMASGASRSSGGEDADWDADLDAYYYGKGGSRRGQAGGASPFMVRRQGSGVAPAGAAGTSPSSTAPGQGGGGVAERLWARLGDQFGMGHAQSGGGSSGSGGGAPSLNSRPGAGELAGGSTLKEALLHDDDTPRSDYGTPSRPAAQDTSGDSTRCCGGAGVPGRGSGLPCTLRAADVRLHAGRVYLTGHNQPGDAWAVPQVLPPHLAALTLQEQWSAFALSLTEQLHWGCAPWDIGAMALLRLVAPPVAEAIMWHRRRTRALLLATAIEQCDCDFLRASRALVLRDALRVYVSPDCTTAAIDILAPAEARPPPATSPGGGVLTRSPSAPADRKGPSLPLALLLSGDGSAACPWSMDPNDALVRSVPLAAGITTFVHNAWVDFVAEFNVRARLVQGDALDATLPPLLAFLRWVNAVSSMTAERSGRSLSGGGDGASRVGRLDLSTASEAPSAPLRSALRSKGGEDPLISSGHLGGLQVSLVRFWPAAQDALSTQVQQARWRSSGRVTLAASRLGVVVQLAAGAGAGEVGAPAASAGWEAIETLAATPRAASGRPGGRHAPTPSRTDAFTPSTGLRAISPARTRSPPSEGAADAAVSPMARLMAQSIARGFAQSRQAGLGVPESRAAGGPSTAPEASVHFQDVATPPSQRAVQLEVTVQGGAAQPATGTAAAVPTPRSAPVRMGPVVAPVWGMPRHVPDACFSPPLRGPPPQAGALVPVSTSPVSRRPRGETWDTAGSSVVLGAPDAGSLDLLSAGARYLQVVGGSILGRRVSMHLPLPGLPLSDEGVGLPRGLPVWAEGAWVFPPALAPTEAGPYQPLSTWTTSPASGGGGAGASPWGLQAPPPAPCGEQCCARCAGDACAGVCVPCAPVVLSEASQLTLSHCARGQCLSTLALCLCSSTRLWQGVPLSAHDAPPRHTATSILQAPLACACIALERLRLTAMCLLCGRALPRGGALLTTLLSLLHVLLLVTDAGGTATLAVAFSCLTGQQVPAGVPGTPPAAASPLASPSPLPTATALAAPLRPTDVQGWADLRPPPVPMPSDITPPSCSWLGGAAAEAGTTPQAATAAYLHWATHGQPDPASFVLEVDDVPALQAELPPGDAPVSGSNSLLNPTLQDGSCDRTPFILVMALPPGALVLAPLLGLVAFSCFSPALWHTYQQYHRLALLAVLVAGALGAGYSTALATYERVLPLGLLLVKLALSLTSPHILASIVSRRPTRGWRGLPGVKRQAD